MGWSSCTLFVVDDEPGTCRSIAAVATSLGLGCETFSSAEEFLARFEPSRRGCLVVGLHLRGTSGLELQERLARLGSKLPVVFLSGFADVPGVVRAMQQGAVTVLEKPCTVGRLLEGIRAALAQSAKNEAAGGARADVQARLDCLSERESLALEQIVAGSPNKTIARNLGVSRRTMDRIRASVFKKLGVSSAVQAARLVALAQQDCAGTIGACEGLIHGPHATSDLLHTSPQGTLPRR